MNLWNGMNRRDLFVKYGPAALFLMAALRAERGLALNRKGRYIMFHTGAGFSIPDFSPNTPSGTTALTDAMFDGKSSKPLAAFKDNMVILRGVGIGPDGTGTNKTGDAHDSGTVWLVTGSENTPEGGNDQSNSGRYATAASFDELVANRRGGQTGIIRSQIAYSYNVARSSGRQSYNSSGQAFNPTQNARELFRSIFGADGNKLFSNCGAGMTPAPTPTPAATVDFQKSRMDANLAEFNSLINSPRLGAAEKDLLKNMMAQLRALETDSTPPIGGDGGTPMTSGDQIAPFCTRMRETKYAGNEGGKAPSGSQVAAVASQVFDIITLALVLDLTDSAALSFVPGGVSSFGYTGIPYTLNGTNYTTDSSAEPHSISHIGLNQDNNAERRAKQSAIDNFHAKQVALLASRLKSFSLGAGTLLDETVIFWGSELGHGHQHTHFDSPITLVGGKNLTNMPSGKIVPLGGKPSIAGVYAALAKRMEINESTVSSAKFRKPAVF